MLSKMCGEPFVISGISGRYPGCCNVNELKKNLFAHVDMMTDREVRWSNTTWSQLPKRKGIVPNVERFDAAYFGIHANLAHSIDPQIRIMLELAYEAIIDAGVNPDALCGSRTNVYIAQGVPETLAYKLCDNKDDESMSLVHGTVPGMLAARVAYHLNLNGNAVVLDTMCSGSITALNCAYEALNNGTCDAALVGACNLMVNASYTSAFMANEMLSKDGFCYSMDDRGNGFARSEAMVMIFLQRETAAKRIYAKIVHVATSSDGFKQEGISHPSIESQTKLFERFYTDIDVDPKSVAFVEMHCTGTIVGDPVECTSVDRVFCRDRDEPLLVGTIKSNMGHAESASGLCGLTKLLLSLETGFVPPNLHFTKPRQDIPSLVAGRLKVCTEKTPLSGSLCALNAFGYGGTNGHCLLRQWSKMKVNGGGPDDSLPRLVNWAGRTGESISSLFDQLVSMPMDAEFIGLLHGIQETVTNGNLCRGFGIFQNQGVTNDAICLAKEQNYVNEEKRPLVWIFSGMGSQWCKMGETLQQIEVARNAIDQCHQILRPFGLDLWSIITTSDSTIFENILHSFVGICCIQIALIDILRAVELPVDYLIGHSVGELVCAYADRSMTLSETIMCAYWRGKISCDEPHIDGLMAAVGMGYADIKDQLPAGIYVACHNSSTSCTLSGPKDSMERFVAELQSKNVFAKMVNTCRLAYHSPYIRGMQMKFLKELEQTIDEPKLRSEKWLSTSVPKECWHLPEARYSSAEYHLNNLLNPVLFEETLRHVPSNAMFIEIAPCGLMQPILKRELPNAIHISMMQRSSENNSLDILKALGRIFMHGTPICIKHLYPPIQFPVSRGTPMIAPLIKWDHGTEWNVPGESGRELSRERKVVIDVNDSEYEYMKGHIIDDRCLLPAMGYLHSVRQSLLRITPGATWDTMNVKFEDLKWIQATTLAPNTRIHLTINIQCDGRFEVTENDSVVVSGMVHIMPSSEPLTLLRVPDSSTTTTLTSHDFYKELRLRGYMYEGEFRSVHTASADGRCATIEWKNDNWATFMDAMLQTSVVTNDSRTTRLPTGIREIKINAIDHLNYLKARQKSDDGSAILCEVHTSSELNTIVCGGIEITGLTTTPISRRHQNGMTVLDRYEFVPLDGQDAVHTMNDAVRICTQIIHETLQTKKIRVVEVLNRDTTDAETRPMIEHLQRILSKMPMLDADLVLMTQRSFPDLVGIDVQSSLELPTRAESSVVVAANCMGDGDFVAAAARNLIENGFLISIEPITIQWMDLIAPNGFQLISLVRSESESLVLMKREPTTKATEAMDSVTIELKSDDTDYKWLRSLQEALASPSMPSITLVAQDDTTSGALGFVNCLRREQTNRKIQLVHIDCKSAPTFDCNRQPYAAQLKLGLPINILRNGCWGTYRHLNIRPCVIEKEGKCRALELHMQQAGDTSSLAWRPAKIPTNHIRTLYAALNFRDVLVANGRLSSDAITTSRIQKENCFGAEYVGVTATGERVMGIGMYGKMKTHIEIDANLTMFSWRVPDHMSSSEAATIPVVYATVYHAFFSHKQITAGQSILIHAGAGGVGISAIRVAIAYGLRVFTTVSSTEKRNYLLQEFPQLNESYVGNSRDCSFEKMIMDETNGIGVDYVLNSLAGEKLMASMRCVRNGGVFLEIGKFDIFNNTSLGLRPFERGITFRAIFLEKISETPAEWQYVHDRMEEDMARGIIKPLPSTVFAARDVVKAFRYLGEAKHIGKVVLRMPEPDADPLTAELKLVPKFVCNPDAVYVVVGGLGGFGMELADWLVIRGAENIVLNSRRGATNAYQLYRIGLWKAYGVNVCISRADTTKRSGCKELLMTANQYGQVQGIFNVAVVLSDHTIENQTPQTFAECLAPKARTTRLLDELSRQLCPSLEHFVVFSSIACGLGNAGQTNYGMANAIMERIIERRVRDKLPGKAIQWGPIDDVGIVAEMLARNSGIKILGTTPQRIHTCMAVMDELVCNRSPIVSSMVISNKEQQKELDLVGTVMNIIGITDIKSISIQATLTQLGVDSLMNNEIRQVLERDFDIRLTTEDIRRLTVIRLAEMASNKDQLPIALDADEPAELFGLKLLANLGNESTKNANIIEGNAAAVSVDESEQCVLVIPGIEGVASDALMNFCRQLKMPAFILQLHTTHAMNDLNDVIAHVADDILELHKNRKRFCIAAYSFGTIVAIEVARLLEREPDRRGHIYLIDGCLGAVHKYVDSFYGCHRNRTDETFAMEIIARHLQNLPAQCRSESTAKLARTKTIDEQVDVFLGLFGTTKYSRGFLREYVIGGINRLAMIEDVYWKTAVPKIDADITLMQATKSFIDCSADGIDLQTNGKIERISINADHDTVLDNDDVVQMIA